MDIKLEQVEQSENGVTLELPTVDQLLENDSYMQSVVANLQANMDSGVFEKENVFSLYGLLRDLREKFSKAIFINPGTSLEDKIEDLRTLSRDDDTVVFCADVCLPGLLAEGINVDYVVTLDPNHKTAHFIENFPLQDTGVIASSFSPIHRYHTDETVFYLYNSLEQTSEFSINRASKDEANPAATLGVELMLEKSRRINDALKDAGVFRRFTPLLARGTVAVTLFQIAAELKLPTEFYGFDFFLRENKPYADFISKAVHSKLLKDKAVADSYSYEDYTSRIVKSYYEDNLTDERKEKSKVEHAELGTIYVPPLLMLYKELFLDYVRISGHSGKNMKFIG